MRALLSVQPGGPESLVLTEVELPVTVPAGHVRVAIKACAVNYPDVLIIADRYQRRPPRPFAPGIDIAGVIEAVGPGVTSLTPGERVMAQLEYGGMAEKVDVVPCRCARLPEALSFEDAAALLTTYGTARFALEDRASIHAGEKLLVLGAAGGVGLAAVELGAAFGATVVAAASSAEKVSVALRKGAVAGVVYPAGAMDKSASKVFAEQIRAAFGGAGPDVILDVVGGDYAEAAFRAIAQHGRFLVVGFAAGIPRMPLNLALLNSASLIGVAWSADLAARPDWLQRQLGALVRLYQAGRIRPEISARFSLRDGAQAIALLAERQAIGKVLVLPG